MIDAIKKYNVSRETIKKLESYQALVKEWNSKFNLISKSTENIIWERHIVDSLQLIKFITQKDKILLDLGSGAGFPGVVLAIACQELYPDLKINLVESIGKKTTFLQEVNKILNLNMEIYKERIENLKTKVESELSHLKKKAELLGAYSNDDENKGSILDFKDE